MKSEAKRSSRFTATARHKQKKSSNKLSQSPTLASSLSEKSLWAHSYKNEPFPKNLRQKLWGKKFQFDDESEDEEEINTVVEEDEAQGVEKKVKRLPHFKLIADHSEFSSSKRCRIKSEFQFRCRQKTKSVESLKCLPQVEEQKREEEELKKVKKFKLKYFKDRNQFNQRKRKSSDSRTQIASQVESLEIANCSAKQRMFPEKIEQNEAEETKSVKLPNERSVITAEIEKLIVDELDSRRKEEPKNKEIEEIINEELNEEEVENAKMAKLRISLSKFESESEYLTLMRDEEFAPRSSRQEIETQKEPSQQSGPQIQVDGEKSRVLNQAENGCEEIEQDNDRNSEQSSSCSEKAASLREDEFEEIQECSSSGKQDDEHPNPDDE